MGLRPLVESDHPRQAQVVATVQEVQVTRHTRLVHGRLAGDSHGRRRWAASTNKWRPLGELGGHLWLHAAHQWQLTVAVAAPPGHSHQIAASGRAACGQLAAVLAFKRLEEAPVDGHALVGELGRWLWLLLLLLLVVGGGRWSSGRLVGRHTLAQVVVERGR